jgi:hypothetical protein
MKPEPRLSDACMTANRLDLIGRIAAALAAHPDEDLTNDQN